MALSVVITTFFVLSKYFTLPVVSKIFLILSYSRLDAVIVLLSLKTFELPVVNIFSSFLR